MNNRKNALRREIRNALRLYSKAELEWMDHRIIQRLMDAELYRHSGRIFLYASKFPEISTLGLIETAVKQGKIVALPKSMAAGMMEFYCYDGKLHPGRYGIQEPVSDRMITPEPEDLMIVPGLCFAKDGHRLGQGGGYYDRYMARYSCNTVGLCRDAFLQETLCTEWNDLPVDCVITESAMFKNKNGASKEAPFV